MVRPEALLIDRQGAAQIWLGLCKPVRGLKQLGQIVDANGDVGMLGPETLLIDRQGAAR
jgi:hypothetical protein